MCPEINPSPVARPAILNRDVMTAFSLGSHRSLRPLPSVDREISDRRNRGRISGGFVVATFLYRAGLLVGFRGRAFLGGLQMLKVGIEAFLGGGIGPFDAGFPRLDRGVQIASRFIEVGDRIE